MAHRIDQLGSVNRPAKTIIHAAILSTALYILTGLSPIVYGLELTNLFFYMDIGPFIIGLAGHSAVGLTNQILSYLGRGWITGRKLGVGVPTLLIASAIVSYWHIPLKSPLGFGICPADLSSPILYMLRRLSYFLVGALLYIGLGQFSQVFQEAFAIGVGKAMGWYGLYLTLLTEPIYIAPPVYFSLSQHHGMGFAMLVMMIFLDFIAVTFLVRHFMRSADRKILPYPMVER
jgi:hypothetical protein